MDELDIENYMAIHKSDSLQFDENLTEKLTRFDEFLCTLIKTHMEIMENALDIGALTGRLCWILNDLGFEAYGLEPQNEACAFARTKGCRYLKDIYMVDLKKSSLLVKDMLKFL
jgi:hypothetical protein